MVDDYVDYRHRTLEVQSIHRKEIIIPMRRKDFGGRNYLFSNMLEFTIERMLDRLSLLNLSGDRSKICSCKQAACLVLQKRRRLSDTPIQQPRGSLLRIAWRFVWLLRTFNKKEPLTLSQTRSAPVCPSSYLCLVAGGCGSCCLEALELVFVVWNLRSSVSFATS